MTTAQHVHSSLNAFVNLSGTSTADRPVLAAPDTYRAAWRVSPHGWEASVWIDPHRPFASLVNTVYVLTDPHGSAVAVQATLSEDNGRLRTGRGVNTALYRAALTHASTEGTEDAPRIVSHSPEAWLAAPVLHAAMLRPYAWLDPAMDETPIEYLHLTDQVHITENAARGVPSQQALTAWLKMCREPEAVEQWILYGMSVEEMRAWSDVLPVDDPVFARMVRACGWSLPDVQAVLTTMSTRASRRTSATSDGALSHRRIEVMEQWRLACEGDTSLAGALASAGMSLPDATRQVPGMSEQDKDGYRTLAALRGGAGRDTRLLRHTLN